jgi:hypothetical protein
MRSKFTTNATKDDLSALEYTYEADNAFSNSIITDVRYWTALFMSLLPYARKIFERKLIPISNIPKPRSVRQTTNDSFANASGLMGYLSQNILKQKGSCISLKDLLDRIIEANNESRKLRDGKQLLESRTIAEGKQEAIVQIQTKFHTIYKINTNPDLKYYISKACRRVKTSTINNIEEFAKKCSSNEELIETFFEKYAVSNTEASTVDDKSDLYIVGYTMKELESYNVDINDDTPEVEDGETKSETTKIPNKAKNIEELDEEDNGGIDGDDLLTEIRIDDYII